MERVKELMEKLKQTAEEGPHREVLNGNNLEELCLGDHIREANRRIAIPFSQESLNNLAVPIFHFIGELIVMSGENYFEGSICETLARDLQEMIDEGVFSTPR